MLTAWLPVSEPNGALPSKLGGSRGQRGEKVILGPQAHPMLELVVCGVQVGAVLEEELNGKVDPADVHIQRRLEVGRRGPLVTWLRHRFAGSLNTHLGSISQLGNSRQEDRAHTLQPAILVGVQSTTVLLDHFDVLDRRVSQLHPVAMPGLVVKDHVEETNQ